MVNRIDADAMDIEANVDRGQQQLLQYLANVSSDRWLMIKVFSIIMAFFVAFLVFL